jgi:hypothetical protein
LKPRTILFWVCNGTLRRTPLSGQSTRISLMATGLLR